MKSLEISRGPAHSQLGNVGPLSPAAAPSAAPQRAPLTTPSASDAPLASGLAHAAPTLDAQAGPPQTSALDVLSSQTSLGARAEGPHRRGRTAALRVRDVKGEADATTKRAFKPLIELSAALQDALAPFGIKR